MKTGRWRRGARAGVFIFCTWWAQGGALLQAAAVDEEATDVLVFRDGDRAAGKLVRREGGMIVFHATRFGELRVPASTAEVIVGSREDRSAGAAAAAAAPSAEPGPAALETKLPWHSPAALTLALREFLGPWQGRFGVSSSLRTETSEQRSFSLEARLGREWSRTEMRFEARYDSAESNGKTTTDLFKGHGVWKQEVRGPLFVSYRPTIEWNRDGEVDDRAIDYVLLQEELGVGLNLLESKDRKLNLGLAENVFNFWTVEPGGEHRLTDNQSVFAEIEWKLPWRITLSERAIWYYSIESGRDGWENRFEVTKKFSDALSLGFRYETRRNNPDTRVNDYSLSRLVMGFDF